MSEIEISDHALAASSRQYGNIDLPTLKGKATMKISILLAAILSVALSAPIASAQETSTPAKPAMGMDMDMDKQMPQMQGNMKKMQQQMEKIRATSDPKERQKLMQEHMQTMQENMKTMHGMGGPMMMGGGQRGGKMMADKKGGMAEGDMMKRHEMMEKRMDMMQMMMDQMMQHNQAIESMPGK
ncbi:hypothetical protein [Dechloromonas sp. A34]|uniref:hypothetical protein n=1 Tax=Dechloromonas sp. A34 TaxID=447588 RepID=UPI0022490AE7|nr:hypothetical protein [Dechloromonas sp. A34]